MDLEKFEVPLEKLRWRLDPKLLPFESTDDLEPLEGVIGQERGLASLRFGMGINKKGYNIMVTGQPRTGRMAMVEKLLREYSLAKESVPDDLCYVNNFKTPEEPVLIRLEAGQGRLFKKDVHQLAENLRREVPGLFESQEYIGRKKEIMEVYEKKIRNFFVELEKKVQEAGFALVNFKTGQHQRPELMPLIDGEPMPILKLEELVEKGRFPKEEYKAVREKYDRLKTKIDQIFLEVRRLQREVQEKCRKTDRIMFDNMVAEQVEPLIQKYPGDKVRKYLLAMTENMSENLEIFFAQQQGVPGIPMLTPADPFGLYQVNLLVDNAEQKGSPVIIEAYPTFRNLFGGIERLVDRMGLWRTDYSMIRAGSFIKANGGFLVFSLMDAIIEPGVWSALKRALKSNKMEIQTFDPFYFFTSSGLKPEPIDIDVKIIITAEPYLYQLLQAFDPDLQKIFKIRADFDQSMNRTDEALIL
ncbi:MAG TPA: ATP-dependent protease, partial [Desulfonatronum sp.]|nr:ATP-dependent protease [Desulfonatronum sp.]